VTTSPLFTSVIVSWNSADHLGECIQAIKRSEAKTDTLVEVIVVDNASTDSSADIASIAGADLVIRNPINAGFAVAASQGIALARGSWIVMTNPDLVVDNFFIGAITDAVKTASVDVACFAPEICFAADSTRLNSRGIGVDNAGLPAEIGKGQLMGDAPVPTEVFAGSGGGAILRRAALDQVGAFEPLYFAYYEDVDLAWRLQRCGWRACFLSSAQASHAGSSTVGVASSLQTHLVARNRRFLFYRHGPHNWRARVWRTLTDTAHGTVLCVMTRSMTPLYGRASALQVRPYLYYLRKRDATYLTGTPEALTARIPFRTALRRKLKSVALEKHS
jgi:N-acetylglucosaminyl-diphospho-decaprenol L-rhamnosyltransferase